jgi:hypothetical protein
VVTRPTHAVAETLREDGLHRAQRRHARISGKKECRVLCAVAPAMG